MKPKAFVSNHLVYALLNYSESLNIDTSAVCQAVGFQPDEQYDPVARIPARQYYKLWQEITARAKIPDFGLSFARETHQQPIGGILYTVMLNCSTVGTAMEKLARYHGLATDMIQIIIRQHGEHIGYAWEPTFEDLPSDRHISEAVISWLYYTIRSLSGGKMPFTGVRFRHRAPSNTTGHPRNFNCPVVFNQERDEIIVPRESLDLPVPLADSRVLHRLENLLHDQLDEIYPPKTWSERVTRWIGDKMLCGELPKLEDIASQAALSSRQLQNKLKDEGTNYRQLLEQTRKEMAVRYLSDRDLNFFDIAFVLGYSDQSAFHNAFKRWTGMTPREFRTQQWKSQ